jgi:hypothetical protein
VPSPPPPLKRKLAAFTGEVVANGGEEKDEEEPGPAAKRPRTDMELHAHFRAFIASLPAWIASLHVSWEGPINWARWCNEAITPHVASLFAPLFKAEKQHPAAWILVLGLHALNTRHGALALQLILFDLINRRGGQSTQWPAQIVDAFKIVFPDADGRHRHMVNIICDVLHTQHQLVQISACGVVTFKYKDVLAEYKITGPLAIPAPAIAGAPAAPVPAPIQ